MRPVLLAIPIWSPIGRLGEIHELDRAGLMMYGQMTAGSWIYIGSQGIVQGTYETLSRSEGAITADLAGRWFLTGGLAAWRAQLWRHHGGLHARGECQPSRIERRLEYPLSRRQGDDLDHALALIKELQQPQAGVVGLLAMPPRSSRAAAPGVRPDR